MKKIYQVPCWQADPTVIRVYEKEVVAETEYHWTIEDHGMFLAYDKTVEPFYYSTEEEAIRVAQKHYHEEIDRHRKFLEGAIEMAQAVDELAKKYK